jgi:diaminopimelate decarboxylase
MLSAARNRLKRMILGQMHRRNERARSNVAARRADYEACWGARYTASGALCIGPADVAALARQFGTPLYVVDQGTLERTYADFIGSFRAVYPRVEVGYSYKTNPLPGVIKELHRLGAWAEVISHFELWLALRLGVAGDRILFNGPAKTGDAIDLAVSQGVALINVDGLAEIDAIERAAERHQRMQPVGVRIVTSVGWSSQFGLSLASGAAFEAFRRIKQMRRLVPVGLHFHLGTGIRDVPIYLQAVGEMLDFARRLRVELGVQIAHIDLGGGFGVPTVRPMSLWDHRLIANGWPPGPVDIAAAPRPRDYAQAIADLVHRHFGSDTASMPTIYFEPGRALTSGAQSLVLKVLAVKRDGRPRPTVILDGGKNIAMPTGYEVHALLPARRGDARTEVVDFYGPLCHPADQLFAAQPFRVLEPGDVVAIMDAGAYFVPNQMNFSNPRPAAVMIRESGDIECLRERESFGDIVRLDRLQERPHRG